MTHTPGPWFKTTFRDGSIDLETHKGSIAHVNEENASLIATSVDLFEACKAFVEAWENGKSKNDTDLAYSKAKAAIAKAEGREP